jgi:pullulanase/glycogen debranching enzyme
LGVVEKIPYLLALGVNCVELLPVFEFCELACAAVAPGTRQPLVNYWGYSPETFMAPMTRYATADVSAPVHRDICDSDDVVQGNAVTELKTMVCVCVCVSLAGGL